MVRTDSVWRSRAYRMLWSGQALSEVGTQITAVALPVTAIVWLHASALQVSILSAARFLPFLLLSVGAGIWVDRVSRPRLMIWSDIHSALILALVPCLYFSGLLNIYVLIVAAFAVSTLRVLFDIAYQAYLPVIVSTHQLASANAKLAAMNAGAGIAGPGVGGLLVQAIGAPLSLVANVISFAFSATTIRRINVTDQHLIRSSSIPIRRELLLGFRYIFQSRFLSWLMIASGINNMAVSSLQGIFFVVAIHLFTFNVSLASALLGAAGIGALLGSLLSEPVGSKIGPYRTMLAGYLAVAIGSAFIAYAFGDRYTAAILIGLGYLIWGTGTGMFNVYAVSLRQQMIPTEIFGRVGGAYRTVLFGLKPFGALLGGAAAEFISYRAGLICCLALNLAALIALHISVKGRRQQPDLVNILPYA